MQFKEAIEALSAALNVGYSVENAMREAYEDIRLLYKNEELIIREFRYMVRQLDMNVTMEAVLNAFRLLQKNQSLKIMMKLRKNG